MLVPPVAPFTGAWIETRLTPGTTGGELVAPFTGAWIETSYYLEYGIWTLGRALHGRVD